MCTTLLTELKHAGRVYCGIVVVYLAYVEHLAAAAGSPLPETDSFYANESYATTSAVAGRQPRTTTDLKKKSVESKE